jgi:hypothetical protein
MPNRRTTSSHRWRALILGVLLLGASGCSDGTGPLPGAGVYVLRSYGARATEVAVSGHVALRPDGSAERVLRYEAQPEYVVRGSYRLDGTRVDLRLREDGGRSPYEWRPHATLENGRLTLRSPSPVDGPDIVEIYERP